MLLFRRAIFNVFAFLLALLAMTASGSSGKAPDPSDASIKPTGLRPVYPAEYDCSPITSGYASWVDVDGSRRDEIHSGIDAGRLGEWVISPGPGTVRAVWKANWKWGTEGALLIRHDRSDLNLSDGPEFYYSEFDHVDFEEIKHFKPGDRIERGERLARVTRPGENETYLPEVHWEVWKIDHDKLTWRKNRYGAPNWWNNSAELVDPLAMLALNNPPADGKSVLITPFDKSANYDGFRGFTYIIECRRK